MKSKEFNELIINKLSHIETELKEVRQTDIPNLQIELAVTKEKTSTTAKVISAVGGLVAIATSTAIAYFRH